MNCVSAITRDDPSLADNSVTDAPATTKGGTTSDASCPPQIWPTTEMCYLTMNNR